MGLVAENSRSTQRLMLPPPTLTASGVFAKFRDIARLTGSAVSGAGRGAPAPRTLCASPRGPKAVCVARGRPLRLIGAGSLQLRCGLRGCPPCFPLSGLRGPSLGILAPELVSVM